MEYRQRRQPNNQGVKKKRVFTPADEEEPANPQRAGHYAGLHGEDQPYITTEAVRQHMKRPAYAPDELEAGQRITTLGRRFPGTPTPMPDGVLYQDGTDQVYVHNGPPPMPLRASRDKNTTAQYQIPQQAASLQGRRQARRRLHPLFFVGLALLIMFLGYVGLNAFTAWWQVHSDDGTYGRPRTFQTNAVVGHHDSPDRPSHFIAVNLNRHVVIIEIPGGDISKTIIYSAGTLMGDGQDLTPITLTFSDVNHDGRPNMLVHILDQIITFTNNGTKFVPPPNVASVGGHPPALGG